MASEIVVALIGGGAGLVTGAIGSLIAPWSQWGVEKRKLQRQSRVDLLAGWREGIAELRRIEDEVAPLIPVPLPGKRGGGHIQSDNGTPDPLSADIGRMSWYADSLRSYLDEASRANIEEVRQQRIIDRKECLLDLLSAEVDKIERGWNLP